MTDDQYIQKLEDTLAQILQRIRGVPFSVVVRALAGHAVIAIDRNCDEDIRLLEKLKEAIRICAVELKKSPIRRPRPNEVGNDVEMFVIDALRKVGFRAERPRSKSGKGKAAGYPDILFYDEKNRPSYIECKIYSATSQDTTMRSFYLSPSEDFKVSIDARHLLVSFEMTRTPVDVARLSEFSAELADARGLSEYKPVSFKLVDLSGLECDVKQEFNADNRRLYDKGLLLFSEFC